MNGSSQREQHRPAFDSLARAHIFLILVAAALLSFSLAIWPVTELQMEVSRLETLAKRARADPQNVLEEYRPRFFANEAARLVQSVRENGYATLIYYQPWVQQKVVSGLVRVTAIDLPVDFDDRTPRQLADLLEREQRVQVTIADRLITCDRQVTGPSILITNVAKNETSPEAVTAEFHLGRRVTRVGEPPRPAGSLQCGWSVVEKMTPVLDEGSFSGFFPLLAGAYRGETVAELRRIQSELRASALARTVEVGGLTINSRHAVIIGATAIFLVLLYMASFARSLGQVEGPSYSWVGALQNIWARSFTVITILLLPAFAVVAGFFAVNQASLALSLLPALPIMVLAALVVYLTEAAIARDR